MPNGPSPDELVLRVNMLVRGQRELRQLAQQTRSAVRDVRKEMRSQAQEIRRARAAQEEATRATKAFQQSQRNLQRAMASAVAAIVAARTAYRNLVGILQAGIDTEKWEVAFERMLGGPIAAQKHLEQLAEFAAKTPFELPQIIEASKLLEALDLRTFDYLETLGDVSAFLDKDLREAVLAVGNAARGEYDNLKTFGVNISLIFERAGLDINKAGRRTQEENKRVVEELIKFWQERFGGGMEALSKTAAGRISNISDAWFQFKLRISRSGVGDVFKEQLGRLLDLIDRLEKEGKLDEIAKEISDALITMGKSLEITIDFLVTWRKELGAIAAAGSIALVASQISQINAALRNTALISLIIKNPQLVIAALGGAAVIYFLTGLKEELKGVNELLEKNAENRKRANRIPVSPFASLQKDPNDPNRLILSRIQLEEEAVTATRLSKQETRKLTAEELADLQKRRAEDLQRYEEYVEAQTKLFEEAVRYRISLSNAEGQARIEDVRNIGEQVLRTTARDERQRVEQLISLEKILAEERDAVRAAENQKKVEDLKKSLEQERAITGASASAFLAMLRSRLDGLDKASAAYRALQDTILAVESEITDSTVQEAARRNELLRQGFDLESATAAARGTLEKFDQDRLTSTQAHLQASQELWFDYFSRLVGVSGVSFDEMTSAQKQKLELAARLSKSSFAAMAGFARGFSTGAREEFDKFFRGAAIGQLQLGRIIKVGAKEAAAAGIESLAQQAEVEAAFNAAKALSAAAEGIFTLNPAKFAAAAKFGLAALKFGALSGAGGAAAAAIRGEAASIGGAPVGEDVSGLFDGTGRDRREGRFNVTGVPQTVTMNFNATIIYQGGLNLFGRDAARTLAQELLPVLQEMIDTKQLKVS